jgi:hypothetical protein
LTNTTSQPLAVTKIGGNCDCARVTPSSAELPARGSAEVQFTYHLIDRHPMDWGKLAREFKGVVAVEVAGRPQAPIALTGVCRSHLATSATVVHFGESNVRGREPVSRWLTVTADADAAGIRVVSHEPCVRIGPVERGGSGWRVQLTPDHARITGPFETGLRIDALDKVGESIGFTRIAVDGVVREAENPPEVPRAP